MTLSVLALLRALPSSLLMTAAPACCSVSLVSLDHISRFSLYSRSGYARGLQPGGWSLLYCLSVAGVEVVVGNMVN